MNLFHGLKIFTLNLILLSLLSCSSSSRYAQLSIIDSFTNNYLLDEERLWSDINGHTNRQNAKNATLTTIFDYYNSNLNQLNFGNIAAVHPVNWKLAEYIREINRTQQGASRLLAERKYELAQQYCEESVARIPSEISQIFDATKSKEFLDYIRENSDFCQTSRRIVSPGVEDLNLYNVVMDFYTTVAEALIKGYMTTQMSYMVLAVRGTTNKYYKKSIELRQSFSTHHKTLETNVRSIVQNFTGEIWNCDDFTREYSYTEITNFIQGYIDNEVNFNFEGSCKATCSDYRYVYQQGCRNSTLCSINFLDKNKTRCDGQIRQCSFIESDMTLCPNEDDQIPSRRYNYIRYSSGLLLGRGKFCPDEVKLKSWTRWFVSCSYCFCYCDYEGLLSDRYFSLRESVSDVSKNKVVTGIRFLKKGRIIHIFISERELLPRGKISEIQTYGETTTWKSDYNFLVEDSGVENGKDYYTLTWKDRAIELDTIRGPLDEVVTGARFRVVNNRLRFEIRTTSFNYETGYLSKAKGVWRGNNDRQKEQIFITDADVPIRSLQKSTRHRRGNQFVEFTPTDVYKDAAQSTVPFIDTLAVEAKVPTPLVGAGIYYKSSPGYGGFIGPLLVLHDFEREYN